MEAGTQSSSNFRLSGKHSSFCCYLKIFVRNFLYGDLSIRLTTNEWPNRTERWNIIQRGMRRRTGAHNITLLRKILCPDLEMKNVKFFSHHFLGNRATQFPSLCLWVTQLCKHIDCYNWELAVLQHCAFNSHGLSQTASCNA